MLISLNNSPQNIGGLGGGGREETVHSNFDQLTFNIYIYKHFFFFFRIFRRAYLMQTYGSKISYAPYRYYKTLC